MKYFTEDSKEIKDILSDIPGCAVNEFKGELEHSEGEMAAEGNGASFVGSFSTEPSDSPFRVRRLSRSFSIPSDCKFEVGVDPLLPRKVEQVEQLLVANNDENFDSDSSNRMKSVKNSRFILLKRSRSLGNIFLPDLPLAREAGVSIENLTEKVEALEVEVLNNDDEAEAQSETFDQVIIIAEDESESESENENENDIACEIESVHAASETSSPLPNVKTITIDRPHTSPPIFYPATCKNHHQVFNDKSKLSILDKMQKSLGFFFRCARKDDDGGLAATGACKDKVRSRTPEPNSKTSSASDEIRLKPIIVDENKTNNSSKPSIVDANSFVTRVDEQQHPKCGDILKKLPQFHDVSGPKGPLLKPILPIDSGKKCLVLDLDETLVHSSFHVPEAHDLVVSLGLPDGSHQNIYVAKRPGVDEFLAKVCEQFEVVIFTASLAHYADPVIDFLCDGMNRHLREPRGIPLRLYRESCLFLRGLYVKDLSRLGRKLEHTVIVDNSPASFLLQPDHGIPIKSWFSDINDRELFHLQDSLDHFVDADTVHDWRMLLVDL